MLRGRWSAPSNEHKGAGQLDLEAHRLDTRIRSGLTPYARNQRSDSWNAVEQFQTSYALISRHAYYHRSWGTVLGVPGVSAPDAIRELQNTVDHDEVGLVKMAVSIDTPFASASHQHREKRGGALSSGSAMTCFGAVR